MHADPFRRLRTIPWAAAEPISEDIVAALERILAGAAADRELDTLLRAHKELSPEARAATAETLFGVGLWRRRLAFHVPEPKPTARMLWFALMRGLAKDLWDDCKRVAGLKETVVLRTGTPESLAVKWSAPDWLTEVVQREFGPDAEKFFRAVAVPGPIYLRTNTLKLTRDELMEKLSHEEVDTKPSKLATAGLFVMSERPNFYGLKAKREALFEVQDEGSQLLIQLLEAQKGETVLDFCAGAGGKTLGLACEVGFEGLVHAWDVDTAKLERLRIRAEQAGATNVRVHSAERASNTHPSPLGALQAHRVLVDAPCSEIGSLRRGPDMRWRMKPELLPELPPLQLEILEQAAAHVAPGGTLLYATCTIRNEENEEVAKAFEARHPKFKRTLPPWAEDFEVEGAFKATPHRHNTDGFFAIRWTRPT